MAQEQLDPFTAQAIPGVMPQADPRDELFRLAAGLQPSRVRLEQVDHDPFAQPPRSFQLPAGYAGGGVPNQAPSSMYDTGPHQLDVPHPSNEQTQRALEKFYGADINPLPDQERGAFSRGFERGMDPASLGLSEESRNWLREHLPDNRFGHGVINAADDVSRGVTGWARMLGALYQGAGDIALSAAGRVGPQTEQLTRDVLAMPDAFMGSPGSSGISRHAVSTIPQALDSLTESNAAGMFGGRLAQTADHGMLAKAEEMANSGAHASRIWQDTGWFKGADGNWKFEIPDNMARVLPGAMETIAGGQQLRLGDVLHHPELYKAYPHIAEEPVGSFQSYMQRKNPLLPEDQVPKVPSSWQGAYSADPTGLGEYLINPKIQPDKARSVLLHEPQHDIQQHEGFSIGGYTGSPDVILAGEGMATKSIAAAEDRIRAIHRDLESWLGKQGIDPSSDPGRVAAAVDRYWTANPELFQEHTDVFNTIAEPAVTRQRAILEQYRRLQGEVEARNVQTRQDMLPEERVAAPPWTTEDRPRDLQVARRPDADLFGSIEEPLGAQVHGLDQQLERALAGVDINGPVHPMDAITNPNITDRLPPEAQALLRQRGELTQQMNARRADIDGQLQEALKGVDVGGYPVEVMDAVINPTIRSQLPQRAQQLLAEREALTAKPKDMSYAYEETPTEPAAASQPAGADPAPTGGGPGGLGRGDPRLAAAQRTAAQAAGAAPKLEGLPDRPLHVGDGEYYVPGPYEPAHRAAEDYARTAGIDYQPPKTYAKVDPERASRIAQAFHDMPHAPNDPRVKASYDALIKETLSQWDAIKKTGLKVDFLKEGQPDPYAATPRLAQKDVAENNHLWVFPSTSGFGSGPEAAAAIKENPLLRPTGETINGHPMVANDVFRIVHDYFGHIKDGNGFRAGGEENAWRSHSAMYSPLARPAMTSETRGQNSWVNYGPHAETNKAASAADTTYAPQKIGLLPDWAINEGRGDPVKGLTRLSLEDTGEFPTTGRQRAITAVNLREMPLDQAIQIARTEQHILPSNSREAYVGAPSWVKSPEDLAKMRADFDAQVKAGAPGAQWYERGQEANRALAGPDPAKQSLLAREQALWSAQSNPDANLGFVTQGHNAYEAGLPLERVRTGAQARTYQQARDAGADIKLGKKTEVYAGHLDPTRENPNTGTNDIWHARAFGYRDAEGTPWGLKGSNAALKPQQHAFLDAETLLAVDRANQQRFGGRSDWTPGEVQAAAWVSAKGQSLAEKRFGGDIPRGIMEAAKGYSEVLDKYTARGTYESIPGAMTGHLPELPLASEAERKAYTMDPRSGWSDEHGRDILYDAAGMYQRNALGATGMYTPPGGQMEINPAGAARPLIGLTGKTANRSLDQYSRALMDSVEAARAYVDAQAGGGWSKIHYGNRPANSVFVPNDKAMTPAQMRMLKEYGQAMNIPDVLDYGQGAALTSFGPAGDPKRIAQALKGDIGYRLEQVAPGNKPPERVGLESNSIDYSEAWKKGEGSGAVTRELEKYLTSPHAPALLAKLDRDPRIRMAVLERIDRDAEYGSRTEQPERADLQRARQIIADKGFSGLFAALRSGVALPAAVGAVLLPYLRNSGSPQEVH